MNRINNVHYFTGCLLKIQILGQGTTGAQLRIFVVVVVSPFDPTLALAPKQYLRSISLIKAKLSRITYRCYGRRRKMTEDDLYDGR